MFAKVRPQVFLDSLRMEFTETAAALRAVLRDEQGTVHRSIDAEVTQRTLRWSDLQDLPYGVYFLKLSDGTDEWEVRLVKRV